MNYERICDEFADIHDVLHLSRLPLAATDGRSSARTVSNDPHMNIVSGTRYLTVI
jgi:hypothetical protein